jgi:hypothetical protein
MSSDNKNKSEGLGDTVKKVLERVTGKKSSCGGCEKRRRLLNQVMPYKKEETK